MSLVTTIGYELSLTIMIFFWGGGGGGACPVWSWSYAVKNDERFVFLNGVDSILLCRQSLLNRSERLTEWAGAGLKSHAVGPQLGSVTETAGEKLKKLKKKN